MCYTQYELSNKNYNFKTTLITNHNNEIDYKSIYNIINNKL